MFPVNSGYFSLGASIVLPDPNQMYLDTRDFVMPEITNYFTFAFGIIGLTLFIKLFFRA
jgi:hypothetical protein